MRKKNYVSPRIEVIEVENEGVMAASLQDWGDNGSPSLPFAASRSRSKNTNVHSTSAFSELEDLINDILTVKK